MLKEHLNYFILSLLNYRTINSYLLSNITTLCTRVTERHGHWEPWVDQQRSPWNGRQPWVGQQLWVVWLLWVGRKRSLGTNVVSARETQGRTSHTCSGQISNHIYEREMKSGKLRKMCITDKNVPIFGFFCKGRRTFG